MGKITGMLVSVILTIKNEETNINACLKSLLNQSHPDLEIIVLDDQSTDMTLEIIKEFTSDQRIKFFTTLGKNIKGHSNRRNYALSKTSGDYIFFTDGDCIPHYNWIYEGLKVFKDTNCSGVEGKTFYEANRGVTVADYVTQRLKPGGYMTCNVAYLKRAIIQVGLFDPRYKYIYEDRDLGMKVRKIGDVLFEPNMLVFHQQKKVTVKTLFNRAKRAGDMVYFDKKHGRSSSEYISFNIIYPQHLLIIIIPPLLLLTSRLTSLQDIYIGIMKYFSFIYERIIIWRESLKYRMFLF